MASTASRGATAAARQGSCAKSACSLAATARRASRKTCLRATHSKIREPSLEWLGETPLNAHASQVQEKGGEAGASTSGSVFPCELQQDLFHVNVGKAMTTLMEEMPHALNRDFTYDIYTDDVAFVDEISPKFRRRAKTVCGKKEYKKTLWSIRFHTWLFFCRSNFEVLKIWQPQEDVIAVRWSLRGMPRIFAGALPGSTTYIDGISEFKLNRQGLIYEHRIDNLDSSNQVWLRDWTTLLSLQPSQQSSWPTPSYYVGDAPESSLSASWSE